MLNISTLKSIDRIFGSFLCSLLPSPGSAEKKTAIRVLVIRPGGIGDAVLLAAAIRCIKESFPDLLLSILGERRNAGVFQLIPGVHEVLCYDVPREFAKALGGRYDVVIDTEQSYRLSAVVARLVRAPMKIGFDTNERQMMFTHGIRYDMDAYEADNFMALLKPLGVDCQRDTGAVTLEVSLESVSKAHQLLEPLGIDSFVVISAGSSIPEKRWGAEPFSLVAKHLVEAGYKVVVVGGQEDRADGKTIIGGEGLNLSGMTSLAETAAVIARASLVICGDSGVLHIAAGLNVPTVSLFGPSSAAKWAPQGGRHAVLDHHLPCAPCSRFGTIPSCPIDARCIKDITPEEVMDAVGRLLS